MSELKQGEKNPQFVGWYITPFGKLVSSTHQKYMTPSCLTHYCINNKKIITQFMFRASKYLQTIGSNVVGRTLQDIGFSFEFKEKNIMYIPTHFGIKELVSEGTYKVRGEKAWALLDDRALHTIDMLREKYGSITINDWSWGGKNHWRGLRTVDSKYFSTYSQHSFGRAFDLIFKNVSAQSVRDDIKANPNDPAFRFINSYEEGTSWLHIDCRNVQRVLTFPVPMTKKK